ncbi:MAG TPA: excinuclease ABC subunit UvrA, partial [Clostridia bacterium]|nr:excinuclease ABC subunit UvrA [Clostridia bacterium]
PHFFSNRLHCAQCDIEYKEPSAALFSFNHPVGACPKCRGFGRVISIDYNLAVPDRSKTLAEGVVKPWQTGQGAECQTDLLRMCREMEIPINVPFNKLPKKWQELVIEGEPGYGEDEEHEWPRAWYGVKGYFRWLESKAYKMHVRVLLSRYRAYTTCPDCRGKRFQPEALLYRVSADSMVASPKSSSRGNGNGIGESAQEANQITLADFYHLPIRDALDFIEATFQSRRFQPNNPLGLVLNEVRSRLSYLNEVGLGYLTLDRPTRSLSGGETERVSLTTCLGTRLVNTLFVLDEPSVGLHPRDTERLVNILQQLRKTGNTVVVVEHEASVMRAADQIIDIGPGHGATGGEIVFQGTFSEVLKSKASLTGQYLSNRKQIEIPRRRPVRMMPGPATDKGRHPRSQATYNLNEAAAPYRTEQEFSPVLKLSQATRNNLQDLSVEIPLNRFVCVTGVSGSGKTTLVREVLLPALASELHSDVDASDAKASDRLSDDTNDNEDEDADPSLRAPTFALLEGAGDLQRVVLVDQSVLGKTPRSNPAVYIGAFDDIREFYAQSELAKQRGLNASAFSFNSGQGQCERCRGAGFEKIEMQFLSDVFVRCPDCDGRRYRSHILEIKISPKEPKSEVRSDPARRRNANGGVEVGRGAGSTVKANQKKSIPSTSSLSIADLLESTVEEVIGFLGSFPESRPARRALQSLQLLQEVGLGYLKLGQPINTLSGGESQRLKLVKHLADSKAGVGTTPPAGGQMTAKERVNGNESRLRTKETQSGEEPFAPTLFLFDEPTTGLHFDDVRVLLKVFQRLVDAGHSVMVIEHNLDVIKSADWVIDLGPDAGDL